MFDNSPDLTAHGRNAVPLQEGGSDPLSPGDNAQYSDKHPNLSVRQDALEDGGMPWRSRYPMRSGEVLRRPRRPSKFASKTLYFIPW